VRNALLPVDEQRRTDDFKDVVVSQLGLDEFQARAQLLELVERDAGQGVVCQRDRAWCP